MVNPTTASRDGFILKRKVEMSTEKMGAVFTNTVAFKIVVSLTDETKRMK
jgi:hypothetical protein